MLRTIWSLLLLLLVGVAAHAETLSFDAALKLVEQQSPDLSAQNAALEAARSTATSAGTLPNPKLALGLENVPVSGADSWRLDRDFMTMQKIGLIQEWPNGKKRQAQINAATATISRVEAERKVRLLALRRDTALAWLNRRYLERQWELLDELEHENELFATVVQAQLAGGRGMPADAVVPRQEAAALADRRDDLNAEIAKAKAGLRRYVGTAGDQELSDQVPVLPIDAEHLRTHVHEHADLQVFAPMLEVAQAELHEAEAMRRPDMEFELAYARRGNAFDDMVSAQVTIGLPLFSGTRIEPQISGKRQALQRIELQREAMLREHRQVLEAELADYQALTQQLTRMRDSKLPLAQEKLDLQFASYQANKLDLTVVLATRRELIDTRLKLIELEAKRTTIAAQLYFAYGEGAQ